MKKFIIFATIGILITRSSIAQTIEMPSLQYGVKPNEFSIGGYFLIGNVASIRDQYGVAFIYGEYGRILNSKSLTNYFALNIFYGYECFIYWDLDSYSGFSIGIYGSWLFDDNLSFQFGIMRHPGGYTDRPYIWRPILAYSIHTRLTNHLFAKFSIGYPYITRFNIGFRL